MFSPPLGCKAVAAVAAARVWSKRRKGQQQATKDQRSRLPNPKFPMSSEQSKPPCLGPEQPERLERGLFNDAVLARFWCALGSFLHPCCRCGLPCSGSWPAPPSFGGLPRFRNSAVDPGARPVVNPVDQRVEMGLTTTETGRSRGLSDGAPTLPGGLQGRSVISAGSCRVRGAWGRGKRKPHAFFFLQPGSKQAWHWHGKSWHSRGSSRADQGPFGQSWRGGRAGEVD